MSGLVESCIGLGANVGDARAVLERAVAALAALPGARVRAVSRLYRTRPVGLVDQPDFLNAAAALLVPEGRTPQDGAMALLIALKQLERALGRRPRQRWGPREVDLDLLLFGRHAIRVERAGAARSDGGGETEWLEVPHPSAQQRLFVLAPLAELVPELEPPGWALNVGETARLAREREEPDAARAVAEWDPGSGRWT